MHSGMVREKIKKERKKKKNKRKKKREEREGTIVVLQNTSLGLFEMDGEG